MTHVTVERHDNIATIVLRNPPLNILTCAAMTELTAALRESRTDDRVVVLRGAGKHFCAGADIAEHLPEKGPAMLETLGLLFSTLRDVPAPTVAVVRGACMGAGLELAAACDFIIAAEDARLGVPEITLGVVAPIASVDLPRKIGEARAAEMLFLGKPISGRQAAEWGLAVEVAMDADLDARADILAAKLAAHSGAALRSTKRCIRAAAARPIHADALCAALGVYKDEVLPSADGLEGLKAFMEKRQAVWRDR
ncbi:MAG: cyclohexa-1 5-dienecarbonyl-CoA [Planctomycetota bacterium]|nr:MAG: cyclohexa-1 5-dienecarbonyl-CoA [Planctomycetota bacterium]